MSYVLLHFALPLLLLLALFFLCLRLALPAAATRLLRLLGSEGSAWMLSSLAFAGFVLALAVTLAYPGLLDSVEASVAAVSWIAVHGQPLYPGPQAPERYAIVYGPLLNLVYGAALRLLGGSYLSLRLAVTAANIAWIALLYLVLRRMLPPARAWLGVAAALLLFLCKSSYIMQVRGDIFLVLAVALGLFAVGVRRRSVAIAGLSFALAFSVDFKVTAVLYFLPLLVLAFKRFGLSSVMVVCIGGAILALAPFLLPNISLSEYLGWIHEVSRQPFSVKEFAGEIAYAALLLVPFALALMRFVSARGAAEARWLLRERRELYLASAVSMALVCVIGAKAGAGRHHLLPWVVLAVYLAADVCSLGRDRANYVAGRQPVVPTREPWDLLLWSAYALLLFAVASDQVVSLWRQCITERPFAVAVSDDLEGILKAHPHQRIEMAYGLVGPHHSVGVAGDVRYNVADYRPLLVYAGDPYTLDPVALGDMQLSGLPLPQATYDYVAQCRTPLWLIQRGDAPFLVQNIYSVLYPKLYPGHWLFDARFRAMFSDTYHLVGETRFYDIYACDRPPATSESERAQNLR